MAKSILPLIFIIIAIGSFFGYTSPQYAKAKVKDAELEKINTALEQADQLRAVRGALGERYNSISPEDLERINKMIPNSVENIRLIIDLNNIASSKGLELLNPSISEEQRAAATTNNVIGPDGKKYGSINMSFSIDTTYEKFLDFVMELERSLRLMDIVSIGFSAPKSKDGGSPTSTFDITIQTYWLKNQ